MQWRSWVRRGAILLVLVPAAAAAATMLAGLVPDRMILDALVDGVERRQIINLPQVGISGRGVDAFSDCLALTMGLGETDGGPATIWLRSPTLGSCDGAIASIQAYRAGEGLTGGYEYFRYWHGYTVFSRPLVATVGVAGARIVLFWTFLGVTALFARRLWRYHGAIAPIALLGPFLLTSDTVELARSLPHGVPATVGIGGAWAVHWAASDRSAPDGTADLRLATVAFLAGAAYVFVDVLTTPPGVWALAVCMALVASANRAAGGRLAVRGLVAGGAWIIGWAWTWISKWIIAAVVLGLDRVRTSIGDAVDDRLAGERDYIDLAPFNAVRVNVELWLDHPLTPPVLIAIAVAAVIRWRRPEHRATWRTRVIVGAPALIPFVWFEVLRNHSLVHPGFVYRSLGVSAGVVALAVLIDSSSLRSSPERRTDSAVPATA